MLRKILEQTIGPMTNAEFEEVMDLVTTDIKTNHVSFGKWTSLSDVVQIAGSCFIALNRCKVA
ncbi:MAG: hypothetical protein APF81_27445 [Desulfosporosinus sp. BRH_c37]|nr:MAG: hypothetical protein APF81_27445 [Desulfosporosinus sp. BRH_c37]